MKAKMKSHWIILRVEFLKNIVVVIYLSIIKKKYLAPFLEIKNNVDKLTVEILHVINILTYYKRKLKILKSIVIFFKKDYQVD